MTNGEKNGSYIISIREKQSSLNDKPYSFFLLQIDITQANTWFLKKMNEGRFM